MNNLLNNLLVMGILLGLFFIAYCKIKGTTIGETIVEIKEALTN
jgi:hypothetical protein